MQAATTHSTKHNITQEQRWYYRIERQFSTQRRLGEFVRDLLRAHSGE